jgi:3-methyladenine DNA glycosylase AlkD
MTEVQKIVREIKILGNPARARLSQSFFKTAKGQYGEGDVFIGLTVPQQRSIALSHLAATLADLEKLLHSKVHEHRFVALEILIAQFERAAASGRKALFDFYIKNSKSANNWDLVDASAPNVVGNYLYNHENKNFMLLKKLAKSKDLWKKRIGIVACMYFIKMKSTKEILEIAEIVKNDKHDLLQKALGWMLRETYKNVDEGVIRKFLKENIKTLPRTTLRYAIERMGEKERKMWLTIK